MESKNISMNTSGLFSTLLLIVFITLKLVGVISWSWWWVLSPLWIPVALVVLFFGVSFLIYMFKK